MNNFDKLLIKSEILRPGYVASLGNGVGEDAAKLIGNMLGKLDEKIPYGVCEIYGKVKGTEHQISEQKYMDLVPGYRLIHINEIEEAVTHIHSAGYGIFPILADYSGNYFGINYKNDEFCAVRIAEPDPVIRVSNNLDSYINTLVSIYNANGFHLDDYGLLESVFEIEGDIGKRMNIGYEYWNN